MIEQTLTGIILQKPEIIADISSIVYPQDFVDFRARNVFEFATKYFKDDRKFDLVVASSLMPKHVQWLAESIDVIPTNYREYAKQINDAARKRRLKEGLTTVIKTDHLTVNEMLSDITAIHKKESVQCGKNGDIKSVVGRTFEIIEKNRGTGKLHGVSTGFSFLDEIYCRFIPGHMWVITGWTSTGKSTLLVEFLERLRNLKVLTISTEMTEEQLVSRMIARDTGYHNQLILSGRVDNQQEIIQSGQKISKRKHILNDNLRDITDIESLVYQESMRNGVDVVFIDYVQQLRANNVPRKEWGRDIADRVQELAKKANTCIVCFSQVSNDVGRGVTDQFEAKGAGEWGTNCDVGVRLKRASKDQYALNFDMQKGRHFGTLSKELSFKANFTRISE